MTTTNIATKFPPGDLKGMDTLINKGVYISRSDLIREATRQLVKEEMEKQNEERRYVFEMAKDGIFKNPDLQVLAQLLLNKELTANEKKRAKKMLRHPAKPVKKVKELFELTEIGKDLAEGFLESLLEFEKHM